MALMTAFSAIILTALAVYSHHSAANNHQNKTPAPPGFLYSDNKAGYQIYNYMNTSDSFSNVTGVSATWTVFTVEPGPDAYLVQWIAIGNSGTRFLNYYHVNDTRQLINVGVDYENGTYYAVYYFAPPQTDLFMRTFRVSPGDSISASVYQTSPGYWELRLADLTNGHSFILNLKEWINNTYGDFVVENPGFIVNHTYTNRISSWKLNQLPGFSGAQFNNVSIMTPSGDLDLCSGSVVTVLMANYSHPRGSNLTVSPEILNCTSFSIKTEG